jgi:recombination protein RecA
MSKLDSVMSEINKSHGDGSVMFLGNKGYVSVDSIPTGSIGLDLALGIGGFPRGRIVEIYGKESSGKTSMCIHAIAEAQKLGGRCAIIDAEHSFDRLYAENLGVNVDELIISQPSTGEEGLEIADKLIGSGEIALIVIDSVAALVPKAELEGEMGDNKIGLHARLMSQALRKITGSVNKTNCVCIFTNQLREKIGVMFGDPSVTTGGNALKYYASIRLDVSRSLSTDNQVKDGKDIMGNLTKVKVVKNKVAPPFKTAEFNILYGVGIDKMGEILHYAVELGFIQKAGSWYSYNDTKIGQGKESVAAFLADNPELAKELHGKIIDKIKNN